MTEMSLGYCIDSVLRGLILRSFSLSQFSPKLKAHGKQRITPWGLRCARDNSISQPKGHGIQAFLISSVERNEVNK